MKSPYETIFHLKPDYKFHRSFGCSCFPFLKDYNKQKFSFHTSKCVFIGYSFLHKGYKCLHPSGKVYISSHVLFDEIFFLYPSLFNHYSSQLNTSASQYNHLQIYSLPTSNNNLNTFAADAPGNDLISPCLDTNASFNSPNTSHISPSSTTQNEHTFHCPSSSEAQMPPSSLAPVSNSQSQHYNLNLSHDHQSKSWHFYT